VYSNDVGRKVVDLQFLVNDREKAKPRVMFFAHEGSNNEQKGLPFLIQNFEWLFPVQSLIGNKMRNYSILGK